MEGDFINYSRLKTRKGPCPRCQLHVNVGEIKCVHCNKTLTSSEQEVIKKYAEAQKSKGVKRALLFFPIAMYIIYLIFVFMQYNKN